MKQSFCDKTIDGIALSRATNEIECEMNTQFEFDLGNLDLDESHTADGRVKSNIIDFFYLTQWAKYLKKCGICTENF